MADGRMSKTKLHAHFAERLGVTRKDAGAFFDELADLAEAELTRCGEFVLPGVCKLVLQNRPERTGRNPATGETITIAAKTVVKARIAKPLKDAIL